MKRDLSILATVAGLMGFGVLCYGLASPDPNAVAASLMAFGFSLVIAFVAALTTGE